MNNFNIEIIPEKGMVFDEKSILFGFSKNDVEALLGTPLIVRNSFYYFNNELRLDFDETGELEFIEFLGGIDSKLKPEIYGLSVFDTLEDIVYGTLIEHNGKDNVKSENGYSYIFGNISVGIFREIKPSDFNETLKEMKKNGIPFESYTDLKKDKQIALHWPTIGFGKKGYYNL